MKSLLISLIFSFLILSTWAQQLNLSLDKISSNDLKAGDTVLVNLNIGKYAHTISSFQLYIEYDINVLEYIETTEVNELLKAAWRSNTTQNLFIGLYLDFNKVGFMMEKDDIICQLSFLYKGGETELVWRKDNKTKEGSNVTAITKFLNSKDKPIDLNLINGCVCKQ